MERKLSKEKTPLSIDKSIKGHGSISLGKACSFNGDGHFSINSSIENNQKTKSCEDDASKLPMSNVRKTFFLLSFNGWILYFAAFLWLIPCRQNGCTLEKIWTMNLHDIDITTNLEFVYDADGKGLFAFSYTNTTDMYPYLAAFESDSGVMRWATSLPFVAGKLRCNNIGSNNYCTVIGDKDIASYNVNGSLRWYAPEVVTDLDKLSPDVLKVSCTRNLSLLLYAKKNNVDDVYLCSLDDGNGQLYSCTPLPCDYLPKQTDYLSEKDELVTSCWRGTKMNAWTLPLDLICSADKLEVILSEETMKLLHLVHSWHSVFDIRVNLPNTLIVTSKGLHMMSGHRPVSTLWKKTFEGDMIVQAITGNFGYGNNEDIMVALDDTKGNIKIKVFNFKDGKEMTSLSIPHQKPISLSLIPRKPEETVIDLALLRTEAALNRNSSGNGEMQYTDELRFTNSTVMTYFVVGHDGSGITLSKVFNSTNIKSAAFASHWKSQNPVIITKDVVDDRTVTFSAYSLKSNKKSCKA